MIFKNAKWICAKECDAPIIEKEFFVENIKNAEINICVLGFFEMFVNGKKVSNDVLTPVCSQYDKSPGKNLLYPLKDEFSGSRIYYNSYNLTEYVHSGNNLIEFMLGNGWYNQKDRTIEGSFGRGVPRMCFEIKLEEKDEKTTCILSDESLLYRPSYIKHNNIFYGEIHDYTKTDTEKKRVVLCETPEAPIMLQKCPPDRVVRKIVPKIVKCKGEKKIFDCGENITGWVSFESVADSEKVVIKFAEELDGERNLDFTSTGYEEKLLQMQKDEFVLNGTERTCRPHFTWHGFRYFELEGKAKNIVAEVVHTDISKKSEFYAENDVLNWLYNGYIRAQLGNMHCGVITDCPHRERIGYTGDAQNTADSAMLMLDSKEVYEKYMGDIADTQDKNSGHIQYTAPFFGGGGGPGGWGCAVVKIPYAHYRHNGDKNILKKYYPNMLKYIDYMVMHSKNGLVVSAEEGGWCLGEWATPERVEVPAEFVNTYFLIKSLQLLKEIAKIIGEDPNVFCKREQICIKALHDNFYNGETHSFCNGANAADAFAADIGIADEICINGLNERYLRKKLDTGIFGTALLTDTLFKNGFQDTAFKLLTEEGKDTFFDHMKKGATTLWEDWQGNGSHNHHMHGAVVSGLFYHILGIDICKNPVISPKIPQKLGYAEGSVKTRFGLVSVSWKKCDGNIYFYIYTDNGGIFKYAGFELEICGGKHNRYVFDGFVCKPHNI